tara:strand:- start:242 stop:1111 length:870 start_codon:yes stop_codon:yes gene_type:complete
MKIKIYIQHKSTIGEIKILKDGVNSHDQLELVSCENDADYIFFDSRDAQDEIKFPKKTIMIDYSDSQNLIQGIYDNVFLYFKRSVCDKFPSRLHDYGDKNIIPISYVVKNEATEWDIKPLNERKTDISLFCNTQEGGHMYVRSQIASFIKNNFSDKYKIHVGYVGKNGGVGRNTIQKDYYNAMLNSKIVVTCNPTHWEGDWRLFEALSCSPLVMVDEMTTPVKNGFIDGEHLIYFSINKLDDLFAKIVYHLENLDNSQTIATSGYRHALKYHTAKNRMDEILEEINNAK